MVVWVKIYSLYISNDFLSDIHHHGTILVVWNGIYYLGSTQKTYGAIQKVLSKYRISSSLVQNDHQWDENMQIIKIVGMRWRYNGNNVFRGYHAVGCTSDQVGYIYHLASDEYKDVTVIKCRNYFKPIFKEFLIVVCDDDNCTNNYCNGVEKVNSTEKFQIAYSQMTSLGVSNTAIVKFVRTGYCIEENPKNFAWLLNWSRNEFDKICVSFNCEYMELTPCDYTASFNLLEEQNKYDYVKYKIMNDFLCQRYYNVLQRDSLQLCELFIGDSDRHKLIPFLKQLLILISSMNSLDDELINVDKYIEDIESFEKSLSMDVANTNMDESMDENMAECEAEPSNSPPTKMAWIEYSNDEYFPISFNDIPSDSRFIKFTYETKDRYIIAFEKTFTRYFVKKFNSSGNSFRFVEQPQDLRTHLKEIFFFNKCSIPILRDFESIMDANYFRNFKGIVSSRKVGLLVRQFVLHGVEYALVDCLEYTKALNYAFQNIIVKCNHVDLNCINEACNVLTPIKRPALFYNEFYIRDPVYAATVTDDWFSETGQLYIYNRGGDGIHYGDYWFPKPIMRVNKKMLLFRLVCYNGVKASKELCNALHEENFYTSVFKKVVDGIIVLTSACLNQEEDIFFLNLSILGSLQLIVDEIGKIHFCCPLAKQIQTIKNGILRKIVESAFLFRGLNSASI